MSCFALHWTGLWRGSCGAGKLLWVRTFQTVEELRQALAEFRERYNQRWIVQRHNYLTSQQARQQLLAIGAAA